VRAKVEHVFRVVKCQFGYRKVRYRGLTKNGAQVFSLLAQRHVLPTVYFRREFAEIGGLVSYGTSVDNIHELVGIYTGRVLKGEKPADLPVVQSTKVE
jgi:hypothetical protein